MKQDYLKLKFILIIKKQDKRKRLIDDFEDIFDNNV